jgi:hypothetical protein
VKYLDAVNIYRNNALKIACMCSNVSAAEITYVADNKLSKVT